MTKVHIFTGPTMPADIILRELPGAMIWPPVAEGDIYRLALQKPAIIGIIDGYFGNLPSVWHKEILFALKEGVHVIGSSSMGALRASELSDFGMIGCGAIYEDYIQGRVEDDDEVTIVHGPAELGFVGLSEAMINIRYTLAEARKQKIISESTHQQLIAYAKNLYYPSRSYSALWDFAATSKLPQDEILNLRAWIKTGYIDQKWLDAKEMLDMVKNMVQQSMGPKSVVYHFEHTSFWEQAVLQNKPA